MSTLDMALLPIILIIAHDMEDGHMVPNNKDPVMALLEVLHSYIPRGIHNIDRGSPEVAACGHV